MDFINALERQLASNGISCDVIASVTQSIRAELGGQTCYVNYGGNRSRDDEIRAEYRKHGSYSRLAAKFGLSERRIREIVHGR